MKELTDYSGGFVPQVSYEIFSKEALIKLLKVFSRNLLHIDALWFKRVTKEVSFDAALSWSTDIWDKQCQYDMKDVMKALNITGNDVETFFKTLQMVPGFPLVLMGYEMDLKTKNHGFLTIHRCPTVDLYEKQGNTGEEILDRVCHELEVPAFKALTLPVNPEIEMTCLKLPPREGKNDICCQWEFKLKAKDSK